jgi:hypothetical protein
MARGRGRPKGKTVLNVEHVEDALRRCLGNPTGAANILEQTYGSCAPRTVRNYILRYPRLKKIADELLQERLDKAELRLDEAVDRGEGWGVCFLLKTRGKDRGYTQQFEAPPNPILVAHAVAVEHRHVVDATGLSPSEAYRLMIQGGSEE